MMIWDAVAIVSDDQMAAVVAAAELRRAGIPTETYLTGKRRSQWEKAKNFEVVILLDDGPTVIDRCLGGRRRVVNDLLCTVHAAFEGFDIEPEQHHADVLKEFDTARNSQKSGQECVNPIPHSGAK